MPDTTPTLSVANLVLRSKQQDIDARFGHAGANDHRLPGYRVEFQPHQCPCTWRNRAARFAKFNI